MANFGLTRREHSIIQGVIDGMRNKEIAYCLGLSEHTVKVYISRIYKKLNVGGNRLNLAHWGRAYADSQRLVNERYRELWPESPQQPPAFENLAAAQFDVFRAMAQTMTFTREQLIEIDGLICAQINRVGTKPSEPPWKTAGNASLDASRDF
jgi:DNA-binding CsgD family transcriptional regulator